MEWCPLWVTRMKQLYSDYLTSSLDYRPKLPFCNTIYLQAATIRFILLFLSIVSCTGIIFSRSKLLFMILFYWHATFSLQDMFSFYYLIIYMCSFTVSLFFENLFAILLSMVLPPCWDCWKMYIHEDIFLFVYFFWV